MIITLVRHAEVEVNYIGKYNGHVDIHLSKKGHKQAKDLAQSLENEEFDAVYCSDLLRARETLDAFKLDIKPLFRTELREKSWGIHEGKSFQEIEESGIKYENFEQWIYALDGEDIDLYRENINEFFHTTLLTNSHKNILVLSHSGFIKTLLSIINKESLEDSFGLKLPYATFIKIKI